MNGRSITALLCLALATAGCGGSGGGGSSNSGNTGTGGGGSGSTNTNSTARIIFPWSTSSAMSDFVTVSGTASDPDGVASVTVNGVTSVKSPGVTTNATWSAEIPLSIGDNQISVSVEDSDGGVTEDAASVSVKFLEVPINFSLDTDATRLIGVSHTVTTTGTARNLVQHDYSTGEQTVFGDLQNTPSWSCFRRFEDEFLYLGLDTGGTWNLYSFDLATGQETAIAEFPAAYLDGGAGYQQGWIRDLVCGDTHTSAYVLVNFIEEGESWFSKSHIIEIDLTTLTFSVLSEPAPGPWLVMHIALDDDNIVGLHDISPREPLSNISLADGTRTILAPGLAVGGVELDPELSSNIVYVATFDGIERIDVNTRTSENISVVSPDHPLAFAQVRAIGFDAPNDRVIVGDSALDALISVDVSTGERSDLVSRRIGSGAPLIAPRSVVLSADASRAWVADDGGNLAERLFEIDLATGDRRSVGNIILPYNFTIRGLAVDEPNRKAYIAFHHVIIEIDLNTELARDVVHVDTSFLQSISSMIHDTANDRLLIGDALADAIYSLELESGTIRLISRDGDRGDGEPFETIVSLAHSGSPTEIFAGDQATGVIYRVNLETGDREALFTNCRSANDPYYETLMKIRYNEAANELLILDDWAFTFDIDRNDCDLLPRRRTLLDLLPASDNRLLATMFGALIQYDRDTGEIVYISK